MGVGLVQKDYCGIKSIHLIDICTSDLPGTRGVATRCRRACQERTRMWAAAPVRARCARPTRGTIHRSAWLRCPGAWRTPGLLPPHPCLAPQIRTRPSSTPTTAATRAHRTPSLSPPAPPHSPTAWPTWGTKGPAQMFSRAQSTRTRTRSAWAPRARPARRILRQPINSGLPALPTASACPASTARMGGQTVRLALAVPTQAPAGRWSAARARPASTIPWRVRRLRQPAAPATPASSWTCLRVQANHHVQLGRSLARLRTIALLVSRASSLCRVRPPAPQRSRVTTSACQMTLRWRAKPALLL